MKLSLVERLEAARTAYYAGTPTMSDAAFDALEDELRQLDSGNAWRPVDGTVSAKM